MYEMRIFRSSAGSDSSREDMMLPSCVGKQRGCRAFDYQSPKVDVDGGKGDRRRGLLIASGRQNHSPAVSSDAPARLDRHVSMRGQTR